MANITENFTEDEFACKCGKCEKIPVLMDPGFMTTLQNARTIAGKSFFITSGFRCPIHPESIKRPTSSHVKGKAADIKADSGYFRLVLLDALLRVGFKRIGIGENFLHVDNDSDKPNSIWHYY